MGHNGLQVNLPPLLPQLGEVVGAAGKVVGPVTQQLTDTAGKLTDTAGKITGGGKGLPLHVNESVEDVWVQEPSPQTHLGYFSSSQHSVDSKSVCSNASDDNSPSPQRSRGSHKQSRIDWMASLFPSFY